MSTQFKVLFSEKADQKVQLAAFAYDRRNNQIGYSTVEKGQFSLPFEKTDLRKIRIVLAPIFEGDSKEIPINQVLKRNPFEVSLPRKFEKTIDLGRIPDSFVEAWFFCICRIRGRLLNSRCENPNVPVEGARVHICEVDHILRLIEVAPDWQIINLRDWILQAVDLKRFVKIPPIIQWPPIGPDPSPIEDIIRKKVDISPNIKDKRALIFNPLQKEQSDSLKKAFSVKSAYIEKALSSNQELFLINEKVTLNQLLPQGSQRMFFSDDVSVIRKYFLEFHPLIFPNICRFISWFYRYDEIATVTSDSNGNFNYYYFYNCKDRPDIYIWVEYPVNGVYTTVYRPYVGCSTRWNYTCGSEIVIHINNPNLPCINEPIVNAPAKSVVVLSMGEWANVAHIEQGSTNTGIPKAGVFKGGPFGSTIDPRVYFHKTLACDVDNPGGLNYFYRWSYRRQGATDWAIMSAPVTRHYEDFIPPNPVPVFPTYQIGPDAEMLYRILRFKTPDNKNIFTKYASDLADGYFETNSLSGHPALSDGVYEVKMELFKYVGSAAQRVNWTAESILLSIPTEDIVSFQNTLITTETNPAKLAPYQYRLLNVAGNLVENPTGDLYGFYMKIYVDNNAPEISIDDFYVDAPGNEPDCCGFVKYGNFNPHIHLDFTAKQKNDFADFQVGIAGYQGIDTIDADSIIPAGAGTFQMQKPSIPSETFTGNILGEYTGDIPVAGALAGCPPPGCTKKVIGIGLNIDWYAHNGTSRLWGSRVSTSTSFAIES